MLIFISSPTALAEISSFTIDKNQYSIEEPIVFSGTVEGEKDSISILALNPAGASEPIYNENLGEEESFLFEYNPSEFFIEDGVYKITAFMSSQPVYDGIAILFDLSGSSIKKVSTDPEKNPRDAQPLPPNCIEIKTEKVTSVICEDSPEEEVAQVEANKIPKWVKQTSLWWSLDNSSDKEFLDSLAFLEHQNFLNIEKSITSDTSGQVPGWLKMSAGWWGKSLISDKEFTDAIEYLSEKEIIIF